jgi:hypothetical protein
MKYIFDEDYVDLCHPSNPNCNSGVTCPDCNDGFNPHLIVKSHLISFSNSPFNTDTTYQPVSIRTVPKIELAMYPNPTAGKFYVDASQLKEAAQIQVLDMQGRVLKTYSKAMDDKRILLDISEFPSGIYVVELLSQQGRFAEKIVKE